MEFFETYGYLAIFLALVLENTVIVGVFFPGVAVVITAGYFAGTGDLNLIVVLGIGVLGVMLGDNIGYLIGRYGLRRFSFVRTLVKKYEPQSRLLHRRVPVILLFFQFPMPTRTAIPIVVGALRLSVRRWIILDLIATILFVGTVTAIGYVIGLAAGTLEIAQSWGARAQIIFILIFAGWLVAWAVRQYRRRSSRSELGEVISSSDKK